MDCLSRTREGQPLSSIAFASLCLQRARDRTCPSSHAPVGYGSRVCLKSVPPKQPTADAVELTVHLSLYHPGLASVYRHGLLPKNGVKLHLVVCKTNPISTQLGMCCMNPCCERGRQVLSLRGEQL